MPRHLITGTEDGDNLLQQDPRADLILGYAGFDNINSGAGNDLVYGGADGDLVITGEGDDHGYGGDGHDVLVGNSGNDTLRGQSGADALIGGPGTDWIYGGADDDSLFSTGGMPVSKEAHAFGGAGNDVLSFAWSDWGTASGGAGSDMLDLWVSDGIGPVTVTLIGGEGTAAQDGRLLALDGIETLRLQAGAGDDTILAEAGNDTIGADLGRNVVEAGAGDDLVSYLTGGANTLAGGSGLDTLEVTAGTDLTVVTFSAAAGVVSDGHGSDLTGFERFVVRGLSAADSADLGGLDDVFLGGDGNDSAQGDGGDDRLRGQDGSDSLWGKAGADRLAGGRDGDVLYGGAGGDWIIGGEGSDLLTGGAGADQFRFAAPEQYFDHITDFEIGSDRLVFARAVLGLGIDVSPADPGFLAINAGTGSQGQFVFFDATSDAPSELRWDPDGAGVSFGTIICVLEGIDSLTAADFLLI